MSDNSCSIARTRVGRYEIGRTLGKGNFAKVKLARNVDTREYVAIKILDKAKIYKENMVEQIKREISTMKRASHPNVVKLYEVMASKSNIYFVMEYVSGGELFNKISREKRLKEDEARKYFQQLINAVSYCHSRGVCHRDLKPENLLLDSQGNLRISDFGLSALPQQCREDGLLHTTCGTPNYVAPEVIVSKGYDGAKADLWSCGVILYVLMAGYLPFDDKNLGNLYKKIYKGEFSFPDSFSSGAKRLISKILTPNPKHRITIDQILRDSWFRKGYKPPRFVANHDVKLDDVDAVFSESEAGLVTEMKRPASLNAFELISLNKGLNLSGLFEDEIDNVQTSHFTSRLSAPEIISKIEETAKPLGFSVHKRDYKMKLQGGDPGSSGHLSISTEVFEVTPSLFMVEIQKAAGDTTDYDKFYRSFSMGLKDIVWNSEVNVAV
ncbi:hypothetical protein KP509_13G026300 [Ceratopteris richardii]|uniref:non-specific serine/threonine protein kinase n=1 Tax=Ceratopteris richardii TaxID=49495 RepID=A0A8T2TC97_CERRI|nr:hypothetical protein KP509_13G026300 [Ceratopteris richardii]